MNRKEFQQQYPFVLDEFQLKAINAVEQQQSVLVSAPTGAGKTLIAEYVMKQCLTKSRGVIYTAPIKALSNQKFREFQKLFPGQVGIVTGDVRINTRAPLTIMTTEIYRNRILEDPESFSAYSWVIYDEIHYLDDMERGTVWEESLIFKPVHMRILGLSATVPNIEELAAWMREIHAQPVTVIVEKQRPVPLRLLFQSRGRITDSLKRLKKASLRQRNYSRRAVKPVQTKKSEGNPQALFAHLRKNQRLPVIYFSFSRKRCEYLAELAAGRESYIADRDGAAAVEEFDRLCENFGITGTSRAGEMRSLIVRGIAYHHAGLHPMLKEVVERLFSLRMIMLIFTTETFALGINMPARTVVVDSLKKRYGRFFRILKNRDFFQMAGRSGRRGIDSEGFVYSRLNEGEVSVFEIDKLFKQGSEPVRSRLNTSYATILNLYDSYGENFLDIYQRSFHYFTEKRKSASRQIRQMRDKLEILRSLEYVQNGELTFKGQFARKMYGYELSLAELFSSGVLERLNDVQLAAVCLAVVYEPRPRSRPQPLAREMRKLRFAVNNRLAPVHQLEKRYLLRDLSKKFYFDLSASMLSWMKEPIFNRLVRESDQDEGEIIRYFRMAIQVMREMLETPASDQFKKRIRRIIAVINQGFVDAESQLRLGIEADLVNSLVEKQD